MATRITPLDTARIEATRWHPVLLADRDPMLSGDQLDALAAWCDAPGRPVAWRVRSTALLPEGLEYGFSDPAVAVEFARTFARLLMPSGAGTSAEAGIPAAHVLPSRILETVRDCGASAYAP